MSDGGACPRCGYAMVLRSGDIWRCSSCRVGVDGSTPSPSAEEEARRLAPCQCGVGVWLGAGRDPRAHASLCPVRLRDAITTALTKRSSHKACPCLHTTPCDTGCTCVQPYSSWGCSRCCSYGNPEQQQAQAEALVKRDALNIEALTAAHAEIARLAGEIAKRDAEIAEYAAHEEQTHRILGGILGTDDSLERCAKRMRERAEAAEAGNANLRKLVDEWNSWGVPAALIRADAAEGRLADAEIERDALRRVVEAARKVADHPEHKGGAWIGLLRDQLAALDPQP